MQKNSLKNSLKNTFKALKIELFGLVQGVGMRPFIYNLAQKYNLCGFVFNDDSGVKLAICGTLSACENFTQELKQNSPPLAKIEKINIFEISQKAFNADYTELCEKSDSIKQKKSKNQKTNLIESIESKSAQNGANAADSMKIIESIFKKEQKFQILPSKSATKIAPILPDFAICKDCEREFNDPKNRRYHHAFINCTNCGPRFSIIKALPYDRANTTMADFAMCEHCKSEFENPKDRRYHAQPIACKNCGPKAIFRSLNGEILATQEEAFKQCAKALQDGKIVAIKGIGGFHLCCNAKNANAIKELRMRKSRPAKPLAIMAKDLQSAKELAQISDFEAQILSSQLRPIMLLKKRQWRDENGLCGNLDSIKSTKNLDSIKNTSLIESGKNLDSIKSTNLIESALEIAAPNTDKIGIFLAPSALHLMLFEFFKNPIIATSANISAEPIITDFIELRAKLNNIADFALDYDRAIINPSDDSVVFCVSVGGENFLRFLRSSRGVRPGILDANFIKCNIESDGNFSENSSAISPKQTAQSPKNGAILAIGAELKNEFAIYQNNKIFRSAYIGDLKNLATMKRFFAALRQFKEAYNLEFTEIIADLHPHFIHTKAFESTEWRELLGLNKNLDSMNLDSIKINSHKSAQSPKISKIQHHKAHIYSVACENKLDFFAPFLAFSFDGTGFGEISAQNTKSEIWGGEVFINSNNGLERAYFVDNFALIGGENAIKNIYFLTYSILRKYNLNSVSFYEWLNNENEFFSKEQLDIAFNAAKIHTSSLGRVFDALSCLILKRGKIDYDAQAAIELEAHYLENLDFTIAPEINNQKISFKRVFAEAVGICDNLDSMKIAQNYAQNYKQNYTQNYTCAQKIATGFINGIAELIANLAKKHNLPVLLSGGCFNNSALLARTIALLKAQNTKFYLGSDCGDGAIALGQIFWSLHKNQLNLASF